jgi:leucyl/phenylalanyl-tRNA--protein transferase
LALFLIMEPNDPYALKLTPEMLLSAYAHGIFPMAESANSNDLFWVDPDERGILPLDGFHISRSLKKKMRQESFEVRVDTNFLSVISACAAERPDSQETWINDEIIELYHALFRAGHCHTVEVWSQGNLVGGLYGISLGGAFFGESMFHKVRDASKIALAHLVDRLVVGGFQLLDTQFITDHLRSLGAIEIPRAQYHAKLSQALQLDGDFYRLDGGGTSEFCLQSTSQIS